MDPVLLSTSDGVATVTLNRPHAGNAIDMALATSLAAVVRSIEADAAVRCVVLRGAGAIFCASGDVRAFADAGADAPSFVRRLAETVHESVLAFARMPQPVVALVNGAAAGAGLSLTLVADVVVASRSAYFLAAYLGIGLTPDGGMSWHLPRVVGLHRAQAMLLLNERVGAEEAVRTGLATKLAEDECLSEVGQEVAARLASGPARAIAGVRRLLTTETLPSLVSQLALEVEEIVNSAASPEAQQAIAHVVARLRASSSMENRG